MALSNNPRLILADLRQGDYAHAGGEEAIDIVIKHATGVLPEKNKLRILDAGCGLGGTAAYICKKIPSEAFGIDIDQSAISHAKQHYPYVHFEICDILNFSQNTTLTFHFIYLFNVLYALQSQQEALAELHRVSEPGSLLAIFDYITLEQDRKILMKDLSGREMNPVSIDTLKIYFANSGWELLDIVDLSKKYQQWYEDFLLKLQMNKQDLLRKFSLDAYDKVLTTFSRLLHDIKNRSLGGAVIYAKAKPSSIGIFANSETTTNNDEKNIKLLRKN